MKFTTITCIILFGLFAVPSQQQDRCIYSREDYVPCKYKEKWIERAGENQYSLHHTYLGQKKNGGVKCRVRAEGQLISDITDLGTHEMRIMYSPGFINDVKYDNQLRVEYRVQCEPDELAFFNMTYLNIQGQDCRDEDSNFRCQDYVQIDRGNFGVSEVCGDTTSTDTVMELEFGNYTVVFRTSEEDRGEGFEMYSICFNAEEKDLPNCFEVSEFNSDTCAASSGTQSPTAQIKREAAQVINDAIEKNKGVDTAYADLFSGYPADLRMAEDLATFHHEWQKMKRSTNDDRMTINILYNQTVNFIRNTLFILDRDDNRTVAQYRVRILKTFDSTGTLKRYVGGIANYSTPHFYGAGVLNIYRRRAYLQLFVIDPRGLVPDAEEQLELIAMNAQLLKSVPAKDDLFYIDKYQRPADLQLGRYLYRGRREVDEELTNADNEAVLAALRNKEACNPVLRAQSRATLTYYTELNASFVEDLQTFDISCSLIGNTLNCSSDSVTLPGRTMCQINNNAPFSCEPFSGLVTIESTAMLVSTAVRVTAINCAGQTADLEVLSLTS